MKLSLVFLFLVSTLLDPDIGVIRIAFQEASRSAEKSAELLSSLSEVSKQSNNVLVAYKGAAMTLQAKYLKKKEEKKRSFKEGTGLLEYAVAQSSTEKDSGVEIRFVRLCIQENAPRFLGYNKNIAEDKAVLLKRYNDIQSSELKALIRDYVLGSDGFSAEEKKRFL